MNAAIKYWYFILDNAPIVYTLRMLSFPKVLEESFGKLNTLKDKLGPTSGLLSTTFGDGFKNLTEMIDVFKVQFEKMRKFYWY